jgi:predicted protein tyrosine phosphatase
MLRSREGDCEGRRRAGAVVSARLHVLSRKEARAAVYRVFGDPTRRLLQPSAIVSLANDEPPPHELVALGVPLLAMQFDDVPRDLPLSGYRAATREQVEQLLVWWSAHRPDDGDVIVHCAAGISRSSACALAMIAASFGGYKARGQARLCILDLLAAVYDSHQQGLRDDATIRPNPRIVWLADQILGWDGHLLAAVEDVFAMRGLWVDLGEEPPKGWPGRVA